MSKEEMLSQNDAATRLGEYCTAASSRMDDTANAEYVLIVEGHPIVADSIAAYIRNLSTSLAVKVAESLEGALDILARESSPLLIVTELSLIDAMGVEVVRRLRVAAPESTIFVFTSTDDQALRNAVVDLGVTQHFVKTTPVKKVQAAILKAIARQTLNGEEARQWIQTELGLTSRQINVLEVLADGCSNKQIAKRLRINADTVATHLKEILSRLGTKNRTEAVVRYLRLKNRSAHRTLSTSDTISR